MTLADAQAEIERLELVAAEPTTEFSEDVPAGTVISSASRACRLGGDVLPGAEVALVVSDGPQPRRVPQLRGLTEDEATQLLDDLGLDPRRRRSRSSTTRSPPARSPRRTPPSTRASTAAARSPPTSPRDPTSSRSRISPG